MADNLSWKAQIAFADRIDTINQMQVPLPYDSTELIQGTYEVKDIEKARKEAQELEYDVYNTATSEEEYDQVLESKLEALVGPSQTAEPVYEPPMASSPSSATAATQIGTYQATYHASGAFSTIYKAYDNNPGTSTATGSGNIIVALKVTKPSQAQAPHDPKREARILAVVKHVSIIPLLSTFSIHDGQFVLTFPFARFNLATVLEAPLHVRRNIIFKNHLRKHMQSLFSALAHIHSLGIIHRDVKPSNILLEGPGGPAFLADFGIAYMPGDPASEPATQKITDVGTTCYRPPELLFGNKSYGISLDLWAAGCVVAETVRKGELFDAGDLGSEFALIKSQFSTLGTPTDETWPEARTFSDWGKFEFTKYPAKSWTEILPDATDAAKDLVSNLVQYESSSRLSAANALSHAYFQEQDDE